jgi:hypothetical protein
MARSIICKLHGSFRWQPSDGSPGMVLGGTKEITIGRSPILIEYHSLFQRIACAGDLRLLERVPTQLNRGDSREAKDRRVYRH